MCVLLGYSNITKRHTLTMALSCPFSLYSTVLIHPFISFKNMFLVHPSISSLLNSLFSRQHVLSFKPFTIFITFAFKMGFSLGKCVKRQTLSWVWWQTDVTPALERLR